MTTKNYDLEVLARTLYGESEPNNFSDAEAIVCVVMNRVGRSHWPDTPAGVCLQPWQFSCNNPGDPNRERITKVTKADIWFQNCMRIAQQAIDGTLNDPTYRSTHYYATYIKMPTWAKGKTPVYEVKHRKNGSHLFFNNIDTRPPETAKESLDQTKPLGSTSTMQAAKIGAVGLTTIGGVSESIRNLTPALDTAQALTQYTPWVLFVVALGVIGFLVYKRWSDREKGKQ